MDPEGPPIDGPSTSHHPPSIDNIRAVNKRKLNGTEDDESGGEKDGQHGQGHSVINGLEGKSDGRDSKDQMSRRRSQRVDSPKSDGKKKVEEELAKEDGEDISSGKKDGPKDKLDPTPTMVSSESTEEGQDDQELDQSADNNDPQNQGIVEESCPFVGCLEKLSVKDLRNHMKYAHKKERPPFPCGFCPHQSTHRLNFLSHHRTHTKAKPFKCGDCQREFSTAGGLKTHQVVHSGDRPFQCSHCDKSFKRSDVLKEHERSHSQERSFVCEVCNELQAVERFVQAQELKEVSLHFATMIVIFPDSPILLPSYPVIVLSIVIEGH